MSGSDEREEVGSVADEAAKLLEALQDWVHTGAGVHGSTEPGGQRGAADEQGPERASAQHGVDGDCRWCPLCRAAALLRQTSPEVRDHLAEAATSLMNAGAAFLQARAARAAAEARAAGATVEEADLGVEHIDLDADDAWDAD